MHRRLVTAWDEIVHRYAGAVRAAVASYRLNPADSADAVQNTWLRLFEHATSIREPEKLGGWLATTARRECLAQIRRQHIEYPLATIDVGQPSPDPTPEATVIICEARRHVRLATDALSARPRALIDAHFTTALVETIPKSHAVLVCQSAASARPGSGLCIAGSSILTGQPEVWTCAARLNEGGP